MAKRIVERPVKDSELAVMSSRRRVSNAYEARRREQGAIAGRRLLDTFDCIRDQGELFDITAVPGRLPTGVIPINNRRRLEKENPTRLAIGVDELDSYRYKAQLIGFGLHPDAEMPPHNSLWDNVQNRLTAEGDEVTYHFSKAMYTLTRTAFVKIMAIDYVDANNDRLGDRWYSSEDDGESI